MRKIGLTSWIILLCISCQSEPVVRQVVSCDTIVLANGEKVRYAGLKGPKEDSGWFAFCRDANAYLVENKSVKLTIEENLSEGDCMVAYVYTPIVEGKETRYLFVNAELARFGFAEVVPEEKGIHKELWQSLWDLQENEAKPLKKGLWSGEAPDEKKSIP